MSLPLSPTMVELFFEVEKLKARRVLREQMDSCIDTIFENMKRKLMQLVECGGIETDDELGDSTDREQQLDTNDINPSTSTNSHVLSHQVNTRSLSADDHFDDNNHPPNGQVNNATDNDTPLDWDQHEIKEEFDDTGNQELLPNHIQNSDIPHINASTTSNEISNHYNLTGFDEENQVNPYQQVNLSDHVKSPIEVEIKKEFDDGEDEVGDDLRDQIGHIPQNVQSHQINFHYNGDQLAQHTDTTHPYDQIQLSNQSISDDQQPNVQVYNATDNDTQQDWDESEIKVEGDDGQMMHIEEVEVVEDFEGGQEDDREFRSVENAWIGPIQHLDNFYPETTDVLDGNDTTKNRDIGEEEGGIDDESDHEEEDEIGDDVILIHSHNDDENQEHGEHRSLENPIDTTLPHHVGPFQEIVIPSARITKRKLIEEKQPNEVNNHDIQENPDEDEEEVTPQSLKRLRSTSLTTSNSCTKQKQIITVALQCPQCPKMFAKDQLTKHLWDAHEIGPYRCPVKDCRQSFENHCILGKHIKQFHQSTRLWHCHKCDKHFTLFEHLSNHNSRQHQLGHFQCSFPACTFTGEYKQKVLNHYAQQHKQTLKKCQHPGCQYETLHSSTFKLHQRVHLGIKPYRCKWSLCDYASADGTAAIRHIRSMHFAHNPSPNGTQLGDPKDFLEVVRELL